MKQGCLIALLILITLAVLDFLFITGIYWALCVLFSWIFKWSTALAIFIIVLIFQVAVVHPLKWASKE